MTGLTWAALSHQIERCATKRFPAERCRFGPRDNRVGWTEQDYVVEVVSTVLPSPIPGMLRVADAALCTEHLALWKTHMEPEEVSA